MRYHSDTEFGAGYSDSAFAFYMIDTEGRKYVRPARLSYAYLLRDVSGYSM